MRPRYRSTMTADLRINGQLQRDLVAGSVAGTVATLAMSVLMQAGQ